MRTESALPHKYLPVGHLWNGSIGNYDRQVLKKEYIVLHTMQGTTPGSTVHFSNVANQASANYGVSLNGDVTLWIPEDCVAYASGNWEVNRKSVSIEHEDGYHPQLRPNAFNEPRPDALYESSARLLADISAHYGIPLDTQHVLLHREVINPKTGRPIQKACPGTLDRDRLLVRANEILRGTTGEEQLVAHMLKPSVFKNLVTKSTNWDDYTALANITPEAAASFGMGRQAWGLHERQLLEARNSVLPPTTSSIGIPADSATTIPPVSLLPQVPRNDSSPVIPRQQRKSVWEKDVLEALQDIARKITGRVTI